MKYISLATLALGLSATFLLGSCDSVLDKQNLSAVEGSLIYNDSTLANLSLNYVYEQNLPAWFGQSSIGFGNPTGLSDESYSDNAFMQGTLQQSDVADIGTALSKDNNYGKIRTINMFIRDVRAGSLPQGTKNRLIAQAQFFRAWRYFDLVRLYGGVPLVYSPLDGVGNEARDLAYLPRNTTTQTFTAIAADLDSAAVSLPGKWAASADWGHITKGAAQAFKGRALLYAASPEFNRSDNTAKWQAAYDASLAARNTLVANGARLHTSYDQLWFQETNNPEAVMVTGFNTASGEQTKKNNGYDNSTRPAYTGTSGGSNLPTWEMVQAYPMLDGKKPGVSTKYAYTTQQFYKNRDPRFDKTIAYNGCNWPLNGNTGYRLWTYQVGTSSVEPSRASNTTFYCRKAISPTASVSDAVYVGTDWIEIRYAEVLLNLAEAACGINNLTEGYTQLKAIRARAGIEAGDGNYGLKVGMSRAEMFEAILYERQLEFAFEGKRFWDLRRHNKLGSVLNTIKRRTGLTITFKPTATLTAATFATTRDGLNLDNVYTNNFTVTTKQVDTKYDLNWLDAKYAFFGIPQSTIDNNPKILQNSNGWGGSFDPLQ